MNMSGKQWHPAEGGYHHRGGISAADHRRNEILQWRFKPVPHKKCRAMHGIFILIRKLLRKRLLCFLGPG